MKSAEQTYITLGKIMLSTHHVLIWKTQLSHFENGLFKNLKNKFCNIGNVKVKKGESQGILNKRAYQRKK